MDAEPSTWQQSLSTLQQLINDSSSNSKIEKAAAAILEADSQSNNGESLPNDVQEVVQTIRLRALIGAGRFADAHQAAQSKDGADANALEEAYSLYRLKKYEACRNVCARYLEQSGDAEGANSRGMMHIYAQTLYRMGETRKADAIYSKILNDKGDLDTDEKEDVLANALANRSANYTPGSLLSSKNDTPWIEQVDEITSLLQSYGTSAANTNEEDMLQNYDLAYNLATYLLISSDARPRSSVIQAKRLLQHAEKSASTVLESSNQPPQDVGVEEDAKKQQQKLIAEKEAMPIKVNLAYAHLLLGGEENNKEALRTYLTCFMEGNKKGAASKGGIEANLLAAASNNLALLRDGKESVFDVLKRIPAASSCSVSEETVKGGKSAGGVTSIPLVGATPQQVRTVLFNRALQLAKMGNAGGCLETLAVLRASLEIAYRGDDEGEGKKTPGSPKSNGKKKKSVGKSESNDVSVSLQDVPTARPSSDVEAIAWNARADWVESELRRVVASDEKKPDDIVRSAISNLDKAEMGSGSGDEAAGALSFMKTQLVLHSAVSNGQTKPQPLIESLQSLPPLVQSSPGTTVTLASLHGVLHKEESTSRSVEIMSSLGDDIPAKLAMAEFYLERNRYDDATKQLESILDENESATTNQLMSATALLVQALSYIDPEKANDYAESLREACGEVEANGEELESMEIPRSAKKAGEASASTSKVRKMIASAGGKRGVARAQGNKKNREAILRKRAKQREAYLKELESKGLYDPNKTPQTKPDPERWIPKSQRSYNRRGRRGRYNSNIGAQGGGAGAGMERDAQKLDVAARVAAAKSGAASGTGKLSTANMQVSGSGPARKGKGKRR
ncbi:hypothetical protein ACHAWO_001793 [Cyclotella atomus]|uniref:Signal recognition particle subunit SRP72 n=1 Tax=Cyclotella atomus TaxID=382360 RepID=A0ABD3MWX3_9STRA